MTSPRPALTSQSIESEDAFEAIERYFENGWTDGLPVVPPRPEVVRRFIATVGRDPSDVLINISETNMHCTVEHAATNAVMAGCKPEYFPVVVAAIEGWADRRWGPTAFYVGNASTGGAGQMAIVSGPIRHELGFNSGINVFGPGPAFRANATVGRALRLIMINALGMVPGVFDMAIQGHPGKYTYCIAEDEESSPWEPLSIERGFAPGTSTVTVVGARGPIPVDERSHDDAEGILDTIAQVMPFARGTGPFVLVMGAEHADIIGRKNGFSKQHVKEYLFERTRRLATPGRRARNVRTVDGQDYIYLTRVPEDILVVVAGGGNGGLTAIIPTWVYAVPPGDFVTREIRRVQ
ncbi:MAG TPA: hypothetical protein VF937_13550 [Chloroflexota bacterium]